MSALLLGIDLGTGSSKAVLTTADGEVVASACREHEVDLPRPGWVEVDAAAVWEAEVASLCRELLARTGGRPVAGVCVSGVGPCLVLCDADDAPVRPAILYGVDTRAGEEIAELTQRYGVDALVRRCGKALSSQAVGPKLLWVRRHEPEVWARAARWHGSSSWVVARLTGEQVQDHATASQCDPLYDLGARDWARDWAQDVAPGLPLPRLAWPGEVVGAVHAAASEATGLPVGTPVCLGTVDAWAEAFSAGVRRPGDVMLMYGSTAFLLQVLAEPRPSPRLWTTCGVEPDHCTLAAGMATAGSLTAWVRRTTGGAPLPELLAEAAAVPPGSDGLVVLPYFAGERTPHYDPRARGVVAGLSLRHGRGHLFRAAHEGTAYGVRQILGALADEGEPIRRLVAVGGGTRHPLWPQVVSDVCGVEQQVPAQTIGASYGSALLAAIGTGAAAPGTDWARPARTVVPDPASREVYDALYTTFTELYPATLPQVHALARAQEAAAG